MADPLVSIVILNWNRKDEIGNSIESVFGQTYKNFEVIVVDNNSTDGSREMLENSALDIRLIKLDENKGVAGGRNVGIKVSKGEFILFLDDDAAINTINGIDLLVNKMRDDPKIGVICCKVVNYYTKEVENYYFKYVDKRNIDREFYVTDFLGGASFIRRSVIGKVGSYREDSLRQMEETDLSYRILDAGYNIVYFPKTEILHKSSQVKRSEYDIFYYNMRNSLLIAWRYLPLPRVILFTMWNIAADFIRAIKADMMPCYFKAYLDIFFSLPRIVIRSRGAIKNETMGKIDYINRNVISDSRDIEKIAPVGSLKYVAHEIKRRFFK